MRPTHESWGILGPDQVGGLRRSRALGLSIAVRAYNNWAVPGLGGVFFSKELVWALLGVSVANITRRNNIEVANAVEALACWWTYEHTSPAWQPHRRMRGSTKLRTRKGGDLVFARMRQPGFYVTQPLRQQTIQPLRALGLVDGRGERFNSFFVTERGEALLRACGLSGARKRLCAWVSGEKDADLKSFGPLLNPLEPVPQEARHLLKQYLVDNQALQAERLRATLAWVETMAHKPNPYAEDAVFRLEAWERWHAWDALRPALSDAHWHDIRSGGALFAARASVIEVLDGLESLLAEAPTTLGMALCAVEIKDGLQKARERADRFLELEKDRDEARDIARTFARKLRESRDEDSLRYIVECDNQGLRLEGANIVKGPLFRGQHRGAEGQSSQPGEFLEESSEPSLAADGDVAWPEGISRRVHGLFALAEDLKGIIIN